MKKYRAIVLCLLVVMLCPAKADGQQPVVLQLRWDHQFQFAGYYAALWQGFYEEEGLDVEIRSALLPSGEIFSAVEEVQAGRALFGVGAGDVLIGNDQGPELSIAAVIFQQSAAAFYLKQTTPFSSLADLTQLRVARRENDLIDVELQAMLLREGIDPALVPPYPHQAGVAHLVSDEVQVMPGYRTTIPFRRDENGEEFKEIRPADYGVDFYGDSIFTTYDLTHDNPDLVERFVRASLKGWRYALENPDETALKITNQLERVAMLDDTLAFNQFQVDAVQELTLYPIVAMGNTNPHRWQLMYTFMREIGLVDQAIDLDRFIFDPERVRAERSAAIQRTVGWGLGTAAIMLVGTFAWSYALRARVNQQTTRIRAEEERFRVLTRNAPNIVFATDNNLRVTYINRTIDGSAPESVTNRHIADMTPPDQVEFVLDQIDRVRTTGKPVDYVSIAKAEFGDYWLDVRVGPLFEDNEIQGFIFILTDITDRQRAAEALRQSEERYRLLAETMQDMILLFNSDGGLLYANRAGLNFAGLTASEIHGQVVPAFVPLLSRTDGSSHTSSPYTSIEDPGRFEMNLEDQEGQPRPFEVSATAISAEDDGLLVVARDITTRKQTEMDLQAYRENLERLVSERTAELQRVVNLMSGREIRMAALKDVIRKQRTQLAEFGVELPPDDLLGEVTDDAA